MVHPAFDTVLSNHGLHPLIRSSPTTLQINVGKRCNQVCKHCHVDAGPHRSESMSSETATRIVRLLQQSPDVHTLDITGGAPELNPNFRLLVREARALNLHVMDRCNLTVLHLPGQGDTAEFLAENQVEIVASLPCYGSKNVDLQRGNGVFNQSIEALQNLNKLGYGSTDTGLQLNLVYNPIGPSLPPDQARLEADYRTRLTEDFGVHFNHLYTITNMPIQRFAGDLERKGLWHQYMSLLVENFNPSAVSTVMCRDLLSVSWKGELFDCDFNQMLDLSTPSTCATIWDIDSLQSFDNDPIATGPHCFGCTAGAGSSCGGALQ
jgi:radical SAM/Cys-rich protein